MKVKKVRKLHTPTITTKELSKGASSSTTITTNGASYNSNNSSNKEEEERTTVDMTGWEEDFDFSDMRGLFFIQKGQYSKSGLCVTVKDGTEYEERWIGGYDPNSSNTKSQYCAIDRITFHSICGCSSLENALECITKCMVTFKNDPKRYFRDVCEHTNEDFYFRHYEGALPISEAALKKRAEEGRCWRASPHTKRNGYAVYKAFGRYFEDEVCDAEDKALSILETQKAERLAKKKNTKCKKVKIKR